MLADSSYPFANAMWTMFVFFAWVLWIWLLIYVYMDIFRRQDTSGWGKFGWVVFTIFLPYIGVFTYLIVEGRAMGERRAEDANQARRETDAYIKSVAGNTADTSADQIAQANQLRSTGAITEAEYERLKEKVLASH